MRNVRVSLVFEFKGGSFAFCLFSFVIVAFYHFADHFYFPSKYVTCYPVIEVDMAKLRIFGSSKLSI